MHALFISFQRLLAGLALIVLVAPLALQAGTPLICHPYAIGKAPSLPGGSGGHGVSQNYDRRTLTADTLALLTPATPTIIRMETLRRAAIYATAQMRGWDKGKYTTEDRAAATELFTALRERTQNATGPAQAMALFDAGFFVETLRHANLDLGVDGYALIAKAGELKGADPEIEFALALASSWPQQKASHDVHLARARQGAASGTLLASNLQTHFSGR